jgi:hypothetical protein
MAKYSDMRKTGKAPTKRLRSQRRWAFLFATGLSIANPVVKQIAEETAWIAIRDVCRVAKLKKSTNSL